MPRKKWGEIRAKAAPETLEAAARDTEEMVAAIQLTELRKARRLTQEEVARRLGIQQANVSKLERRPDVRLSTLRDMVKAMGGELRLVAHFPDADYQIDTPEIPADTSEGSRPAA